MLRLLALLALCALLLPSRAWAFPWVIRHGYTSCGECHQDPSGGGVLTAYGRAQAQILLASPYGRGDDWEPGEGSAFLWGAAPLPSSLALQFDNRSLLVPEPGNTRFIQMQTDLRGQVKRGQVRGSLGLGYANTGAEAARVTSQPSHNLVSRDHWVGVDMSPFLLVRGGRMALPYGIRSEDHFLYPIAATRTDINDQQQHGLALSYNRAPWRAEVMGVAGNFQVSPDDFRERGMAAYGARRLGPTSEVGLSLLGARSGRDVDTLAPRTRLAGGLFGRTAPWTPLVLLAQADLLYEVTSSQPGLAAYLQADWEPSQGFHVKATGEYCDDDLPQGPAGVATGILSGQWFILSRLDVRVDGVRGSLGCTPGTAPQWMGLAQVHFLL